MLINKTTIVLIVYVIGMIFCALVLGIWNAKTSIIEATIALVWTTIFLIALFYADKYDKK
tara:strand:+ start:71 stop:250 length:180 start_codon:yes stop_codon:yes gene_type:complete